MKPDVLLWIYIVLLLVGGVFGFVKAKSLISLVTSIVFAALLAAAASGVFKWFFAADLILVLLVVVFAFRFQKTRKLMPAGVMTLATIAVILLRMMTWIG